MGCARPRSRCATPPGRPPDFLEHLRQARLLQRRQPGGQRQRQFDFDLGDVRLGALRCVRLSHLGDQRCAVLVEAVAGLCRDREFRCELEVRAVGRLEAVGDGDWLIVGGARDVRARAEYCCADAHRLAAGRVEQEALPIDIDMNRAQVDHDPLMMWGIWSAAPSGMLTCAVYGSMVSGRCTTTVPRSNGPTLAEVIEIREKGAPSNGPPR